MMRQVVAFLALTGASAAMGASHEFQHMRGKAFLASDLQPEMVAHTLVSVLDEWKAQASAFEECKATAEDLPSCNEARNAFEHSCYTVTNAIVSGSSGDRDVAKDYMGEICGQKELTKSLWGQQRCLDLANAVNKAMLDSSYENRVNFDSQKMCNGFWAKFSEEERVRVEKEMALRAEAEKKAAEERAEAEKKAAEERAEAEKKAAEERAEAEKKAAEEKKKAEEEAKRKAEEEAKQAAARAAEEAKAKLAEAAARLKAKKAEAEEIARAAKQKMEEAAAVEREHQELMAKANATAATQPAEQKANAAKPAKVAATAKGEDAQANNTASKATTPTAAPAKSAGESTVNKTTN